MTHRGPFQPLLFCDSVVGRGSVGGTEAPGERFPPSKSCRGVWKTRS